MTKNVTKMVSDTAAQIHTIHPVGRKAKTVGSDGFEQLKGQALRLTTVDKTARFYLKLEFRARESLWRKLTPAEHHHPKKQARSAYFLHHLHMRVRRRTGHVSRGQQETGSTLKGAGIYSRCPVCLPALVANAELWQVGKWKASCLQMTYGS